VSRGGTRPLTRPGELLLVLAANGAAQAAPATRVAAWKDPNCGCCEGWIRHLRQAGSEVALPKVADVTQLTTSSGSPEALRSCHIALVDVYAIEGHVPAADLRRLLAERPRRPGREPLDGAAGLSAQPPAPPGRCCAM
jgi:hypothetical protein